MLCLLLPTIVTVMTLAIFTPISPEDELTPKAGTDSFSPGHFKAIVLNHQKSIRNSASQLLGKFRIRGGDAVPSFGGIRTGADPERLKSGQGAEKVSRSYAPWLHTRMQHSVRSVGWFSKGCIEWHHAL